MPTASAVFPWLDPDEANVRANVLDDLVLDGVSLDAHVASALQDIPFERTILGASTVQLLLIDPDGDLLDSGLFSHKAEIVLPSPTGRMLGFTLVRITPAAPLLTLEFEDREVNLLRGHNTPRHASRADVTRAEFIRMLVREESSIRFWSPELRTKQPIGKRRDLTPKTSKKAQRDPGFGSSKPKVKGNTADASQMRVIEAVLDTALSLGANRREQVGVIECITQEAGATNPAGQPIGAPRAGTGGGGSSGHLINVGPFQQDSRYWPATRDVPTDAAAFIKKFIPLARAHTDKSIGWCVDEVQRSFTFGTARQGTLYDQWEHEASQTVDTYTGRQSNAGQLADSTYTQRYLFRRDEPGQPRENTWDCSGRLADEVKWRRFMDLGVFHYASDDYLIKSAPRLAIDRNDMPAGVAAVRPRDFDVGKKTATVEVDVFADAIEPPIGAVWTLKGYGPFDHRYLITDVKGSYLRPVVTVTLELAVPKLPEPAPTTATRQRVQAASGNFRKVRGQNLIYPLAKDGKEIQGPGAGNSAYQGSSNGTHRWGGQFSNWQSCNAVDISAAIGTELFAVDDGVIVRLGGAYDGTGRSNPNGFNVTLKTAKNEWFYTHLSERKPLKIGQHISAGQSLGRSGAANSVAHLHIGCIKGNPEDLLGANRLPSTTIPTTANGRPNLP